MLWLTDLLYHLIDQRNDRLVDVMTLVDCFDHLVLRNLIGSCLDHDNLLSSRCNSQTKITVVPYLLAWVYDKLTVYHTHLGCCTWTVKWNI